MDVPGWYVKKGNHPVVRSTTFRGVDIAIETDKGQERHWYDSASGERGSTKMRFPYGYFKGTKASNMSGDGMALDVYVGPHEDADGVYVVHQMKKPDFKTEDELKVMVGFETEKRARAAYLMHYNDERFLGTVDSMTWAEFVDKYIDPFVKKGFDDPNMRSSAAGNSAVQSPNANGVQQQMAADSPMPMRVPSMPFMGPGQLMSPMPMAPPVDVDTLDGVESLLNQIGGMKDGQLISTAEKIWGPGYQFINATPEHVRCEIRGFLLDQRDLFETRQEMEEQARGMLNIPPPSPPPPAPMFSPSLPPSSGSPTSMGGAFGAPSSSPAASSSPPSSGSSSSASSSKSGAPPKKAPSSDTESAQDSSGS